MIRTTIIFLAMLAASVLLFLGIRELRTSRGRHGLFLTTLLAALGLAGCGGTPRATETAHDRATTEPTLVPMPADDPSKSPEMVELAKTKQWADFKALWKKLDHVRPTKEGDEAFMGEYVGSLTYEVAQEMREELDQLIDALRSPSMKKHIGDMEIDLLQTITHKRINYLEYGLQSMMTRMVQPPMMMDKEDSIRDLEKHIDVLVELREAGKISGLEFEEALAIVEDDVKAWAVLDTLSESYMGYYSLPVHTIVEGREGSGISVSVAESLIAAFERDYDDFQSKAVQAQQGTDKELAKQYEKAKEAVDELKLVLPFLSELVEDLES